MPRLQLQEQSTQTIQRTSKNNSNYIPANDPEMFGLLSDNRTHEEFFSRVDKFYVNHYYYVGTQQLKEVIFYPSAYGRNLIEDEPRHPCKKLLKRLIDEGIGLIGERITPVIEKPVKRLELECRPKRMLLECNE